jgi:twinkle protein
MARVLSDSMDWAAYERATDPQVQVRRASEFADDLVAEFSDRPVHQRSVMFSTKLRSVIEFRPGEVTAWMGYSGHRKSMFTSQVALDLCVQREPVLMASFEMTPGKTLARMARQCLGAKRPAGAALARFSAWTDGRLWLFDHLGRIAPAKVLAVCRYFAEELKGRHVVIDSMMMVCASEEHLDEQKQLVTDLVRVAQEHGLHIHLVAHARKPAGGGESNPPTKYDLRGSAAVTDQVANVITIWQDKAKRAEREKKIPSADVMANPDALVTVEKQRNGEYEGRLMLWFDDASLRFCDDRGTPVEPYVMEAA